MNDRDAQRLHLREDPCGVRMRELAVIIAPECADLLATRCRWVEEVGGRWLGSSLEAIRLTADKWALGRVTLEPTRPEGGLANKRSGASPLAGRQGVEPRLSGSEPLVLPLNDLPELGGRGCYTALNAPVNILIPASGARDSAAFRATIAGRG